MDTISRESNSSSYLPVAAIIVGLIAIVLSIIALAKFSGVDQKIASAQSGQSDRISSLEDQIRTATASAENASATITSLRRSVQDSFGEVGNRLGDVNERIAKLQELAAKPAPAPVAPKTSGGSTAAPVAGPNEYVIKSGDTGTRIASAHGVSLSDLIAVNPGINWNRLAIGQKIKLPAK